jgi:hypothetical protein
MAKKKTDATTSADGGLDNNGEKIVDKKQQRVVIQPKNKMQWGAILLQAASEHWRTLKIRVRIREKMLAGKPVSLDVAEKMLKARGLEDQIAALPEDDAGRAEKAVQVIEEGVCEFFRRPGKIGPDGVEGIWYPTNHLKAGIKENWSVLGLRNEIRGSRGAIAEGLFVYSEVPPGETNEERNWIYLGPLTPPAGWDKDKKWPPQHTAIAHTMSPKGPVHSLKRHEYVERVEFTFVVSIARVLLEANKIPDDKFADMMVHFAEHGTGACRSQGFGQFDIISIEDVVLSAGERAELGEPPSLRAVAGQ